MKRWILTMAATGLLAGCAMAPTAYHAGSGYVEQGVVREVRAVMVQPQGGYNVGTAIGGAVGSAAGYTLTHNTRGYASGLGTLVGGVAGAAVGQSLGNRPHPGVLVIVEEGTRLVSIVQDSSQGLHPGVPVFVVRNGNTAQAVAQ